MRDLTYLLCCVFVFSFLYSCSEKETTTTLETINIDYNNEVNVENSLTTNYFKSRKLIKLETTKESLISNISRLIVFDNYYFIFDQDTKSIYKFNEFGKYISKINRIGKGPGQYLKISDFTIDTKEKQIILLSNTPNDLMYFDLDFNFIKQTKNTEYYSYISTDQSSMYLINSLAKYDGNYISINHGDKHNEFLPVESFIKDKVFYSQRPNIIKSDHIYFFKVYDNIVYEVAENNVLPKYQIEFGEKAVGQNLIEENELMNIFQICSKEGLICRINDFREGDHYLTFGMWPFNKIVIYNKKEKIGQLFSTFYDPVTGLYLSEIIGYDGIGDDMMFLVRPEQFINNVLNNKNKEELVQDKLYASYKEIANSLTPSDNPILMVYSLNDN